MDSNVTPLVAGNWKMNGTRASLLEMEKLAKLVTEAPEPRCTVALCPPATLIAAANRIAAPAGILLGGQDCHTHAKGAFTGDVSAAMLVDCGAQFVIVGHSERRAGHGETDAIVRQKAQAAFGAGLTPIVCVGETRAEREAGRAGDVVSAQLSGSLPDEAKDTDLVVAYEPVWAIGTGLVATVSDIETMHARIRDDLIARFGGAAARMRILYGGSVKPDNAAEIFTIPNVNGALVGGASLLADDFAAIISAA
jgi:triosephosphate isomerase